MKKILILADANNPHVIKWVNGLLGNGFSIYLFSLNNYKHRNFLSVGDLEVTCFDFNINTNSNNSGSFKKLKYLKVLKHLKKLIFDIKPDILHSHYASSYGFLGALTSFHPYVISVWGDDVFDFPKRSYLHKRLIEYNLNKCDYVLSTSKIMANETKKYTKKSIIITPFGVDLEVFKPMDVKSLFDENDVVIGTIKTLEEKYGVEYLVRAFKILKDRLPGVSLKLLIVGTGSLEKPLKELVEDLGLEDFVLFTGRIDYSDIPRYHNMLDVSVSVSTTDGESFGVAVVEASACGVPVVVSNVGGLPEVVVDNITGLIVKPRSVKDTAYAIEKIVTNKQLKLTLGVNGRKRVNELYNWDDNLKLIIKFYKGVK